MQLHQLQRRNPNKTKKRVGRGVTRGKTSGRGHKGQKQHGGTPRPEMRDLIKRLPKLRGHGKNRARTVHGGKLNNAVINVATVEAFFNDGDTVSPQTLLEKGLVRRQRGRAPQVKILGSGDITKKCTFEGCTVSVKALEKIQAAGGTVNAQ